MVAVFIAACVYFQFVTPHKSEETLNVGVLVSLTGGFSSFGEDIKNGLDLIKKDLAADGTKVNFVYEDTASDPKKAVLAARKLIDIDKVSMIISGPGSSVNIAVAPIMEETKTIFIAISSTPKLNTAGEYVFKLQPDIDAEIDQIIPFMLDKGIKNLAVIYDSSSDTHVFAKDYVKEQYEAAGGRIVAMEGFDGKSVTDYRSQLTKLRGAQPDAYYVLTNDKSAGGVVRQAREQGITEQFLSWSGIVGSEFFKQTGEYAEGVIVTDQLFSCEGSVAMQQYCYNYRKEFNNREPLKFSVHAYDVMRIITEALEDESDTYKAVADALTSETYGDSLVGVLNFDENGNTLEQDFEVRVAKNGKFEKM